MLLRAPQRARGTPKALASLGREPWTLIGPLLALLHGDQPEGGRQRKPASPLPCKDPVFALLGDKGCVREASCVLLVRDSGVARLRKSSSRPCKADGEC